MTLTWDIEKCNFEIIFDNRISCIVDRAIFIDIQMKKVLEAFFSRKLMKVVSICIFSAESIEPRCQVLTGLVFTEIGHFHSNHILRLICQGYYVVAMEMSIFCKNEAS